MSRMRDLINKCPIWNFLAAVSAVSGLGCFGLSFTYKMSFGKFGIWGLLVYLLISSIVLCLIYLVKGIKVKKIFQVGVVIVLLVVICVISVELDKHVPEKSDALSIISYGLFALLSLCASRKFELGFETGGFMFFVSLFLEQTYKTNLKLFPIAVILCSVIVVLRYCSQYGRRDVGDKGVLIEFCSKIFKQLNRTSNIYLAVLLLRHRSPNGEGPLINATAPETDNDEYLDLESQSSLEQSLLPSRNQENNPGESYGAAHHPLSNTGGVSEESTLEEIRSSFPARRRHSPINDGQASEANIEEIRSSFLARHRLPSNDGQSARANGDHSQEVPLINGTASATDNHGDLDLELQDPPRVRQDSGESLSSTGNQENNQEESNEARPRHSPINYGQASEANRSFPAESSYSSEQDHAPPANYQNGYVHTHPLLGLFRRRGRMSTPAIQNMTSSLGVGDTLSGSTPTTPLLLSFCFFFFNPRS